jgi:imidazolonepropionase-like amidohydrolase
LENAALLHQAGVKIAMTTEGNSAARLLTQYAGNAVANGLPHGAALLALTRNPAEIYGIDDRVGTLAPGRDADIVIWSGDPFEVMHAPTHVFIQGEDVPLISRQIRLRERYRNLQD